MRACFVVITLLVCGLARAAEHIDVRIEGLAEEELEENVRAYLSIVERSEEQEDDDEPLTERAVRNLHARASGEIRRALQPFGYYSPVIETRLEGEPGAWRATYVIDPGPPTRLTRVEIDVLGEAGELRVMEEALADIDLAPGGILRHRAYEQAKERLLDTAYDAGFLDARYERSEIRVLPHELRAEIWLILESRPRYYFGEVRIEQDILNADFVQRYVRIEPGEPFATDRLIDLQLALSDSDYFNSVDIEVRRSAADDFRVPVIVRTQPRKSQRYTAGGGYGTDTGPRISIGTEFRRINQRGHRFNSRLELSEIKNTLSAEYRVPIKRVATDRLSYFASLQEADIGDADSELGTLGASREDSWLGLRRQIYLRFDRENFSFGDAPGGSATLLYPGVNLAYTAADDPLFPRRGFSAAIDVHGGSQNALSETSFVQSTLGAKTVFPLGERGRLLLRGEIGATRADEFSMLPPSQRFFAGGDRSVRGYGYQELSPENAAGDDVGGQYFLAGSVEVDFLVRGNYGIAAFFDTGNAMSNLNADLASGVGVGFRYRSPVGMIRVDFAHPLDDPDRDFHLHISVGPDL
ncbi:MAG TPA: autotransporter assembly complex family protein [Gammaproteobacteria bacterium]|nr:autotransporter assembly complex family protein [Gammaproteobacteria bacterium]